MFEKFLSFIGYQPPNEITTREEFCAYLGGKNLLNGLYRFIPTDQVISWNDVVGTAYPDYFGTITCFAYDWMGCIYAVYHPNDTVIVFEPGTGFILTVNDKHASFEAFHDIGIAELHDDYLLSNVYQRWLAVEGNQPIQADECIGYIIPLFLSGDDDFSNMEVSTMKVYWDVMGMLLSIVG